MDKLHEEQKRGGALVAFDYSGCYMTRIIHDAGEPLPDNHRAEVILHDGQWYFGEYSSLEQLHDFAEAVGFTWELHHTERMDRARVGQTSNWVPCKPYTIEYYLLSHDFDTDAVCHKTKWGAFPGFWDLCELPEGIVPFIGLSNGSLVTCYALNKEGKISLYRPNPNAKEVYKPLTMAEHHLYIRQHGDMGPYTKFISKHPATWPASQPDTEERIIHYLNTHTLDPIFEDYGDFVDLNPKWLTPSMARQYGGCVHFLGNFYDVSGVFDVVTNDPRLFVRLLEAIRRNQKTAAYAAAKAEIKAKKEVR